MSQRELDEKVLAVLNAADKPLGQAAIAKQLPEPYCYFATAMITRSLKRVAAVCIGRGAYVKPNRGLNW